MSFQPVIVGSGLAGWSMLKSTMERQLTQFAARPDVRRDVAHFRSAIPEQGSAEDLVQDRTALRVALGAFGLIDDLNNRYFIGRVLQEGTEDEHALANRLTDDRYRSMATMFSSLNYSLTLTKTEAFADDVVARYQAVSFEAAVGEVDGNLRLALAFQRLLPEIAKDSGTNNAAWYHVMGQPPVRSVMEGALSLPASVGKLDIDRQLELFKDKARQLFGTDDLTTIALEENRETAIRRFLVRAQLAEAPSAVGMQAALSLVSQTAQFMRANN